MDNSEIIETITDTIEESPVLSRGIDFLAETPLGTATVVVVILSIFFFLRRFWARLLLKIVNKIARKSHVELNEEILFSLEGPLRIFFVLLGITLALLYLPLTPYQQDFLVLKFFRVALIIITAWILYNLIDTCVFEVINRKLKFELDKIIIPFLTKVLRFIVIALAVTIIIQEGGYDITALVTGLGLGGLAVALAAKDAVANVFSGFIIITEKPFTIGDWIYTPSVEGTVEDISFRSTKVRTFARALVTVPNSTLANEAITNWTRMNKRRVTFHLGVTYTTPREKLEKCIEKIKDLLHDNPEIDQETIFVTFDRYNDSSLDIFLYYFTVTTAWKKHLLVKEKINFKIMEILENEGVSVAFPSRSLYFETQLSYREDSSGNKQISSHEEQEEHEQYEQDRNEDKNN